MKFASKDINKLPLKNNFLDEKWKVLIVDDEVEVHRLTELVLEDFSFEDKGLEFHNAYSAKEAINILKKDNDFALIFLDVVMETDDAGLILVKQIREDLNITNTRIILRTGQPGTAPENEVIRDYDINDYKEKTELTSTKLFSSVISSLRAYRYIKTIEYNKLGLSKIIEASKSIFELKSILLFVEGVLTQLISILNLNKHMKIELSHAFFARLIAGKFELLATTGKFQHKDRGKIITPAAIELLNIAYEKKHNFFEGDFYVGYYESSDRQSIFLYLEGCDKLNELDKKFLIMFSESISNAFENICLHDEVINTQKEIIERLGGIVETRSQEAAYHVTRVAELSYFLAIKSGLNKEEAIRIKYASPMHDVGKIGIPDNILLKPGKLTAKEFEIMKTHSEIGQHIFANTQREILKVAETLAYQHHEKYNGTGYPQGLIGEEISIYGRITALADVFDALSQKRSYKDAWPIEKVIEYITDERGKHFDPKLVDIFVEHIDQIKEICKIS